MQEIRRGSPKTFIAVLTDDQHGVREKQMAGLPGSGRTMNDRRISATASFRCTGERTWF